MIRLFNFATFLRRIIQRMLRIKSIGVRTLVLNEQGQVLLVRHTYAPGWHLPGGGVNAKETPKQAALREAYEEAGIKTQGEPALMGVYYHTVRGADDYVVLYVIHSFVQDDVHSPEIAEYCWADAHRLPAGTTASTERRLQEYFDATPIAENW